MQHGQYKTRLYNIWREMRHRCGNPTDRDYFYYGLRGIRVCPEWDASFIAFREWALSHGYADDLTIDRIDHHGNYEPDNCRWITRSENSTEVGKRRKGVTKDIQAARRLWRKIYERTGPDIPETTRNALIKAMETTEFPILPIPIRGKRSEEKKPPAAEEKAADGNGQG